jgi:hypothetical protein
VVVGASVVVVEVVVDVVLVVDVVVDGRVVVEGSGSAKELPDPHPVATSAARPRPAMALRATR